MKLPSTSRKNTGPRSYIRDGVELSAAQQKRMPESEAMNKDDGPHHSQEKTNTQPAEQKDPLQLIDMPTEIIDMIFAFLPEDLLITERLRAGYQDKWDGTADGTGLVALNSQAWCALLALKEVSHLFLDATTRAIEEAARSGATRAILNVSNTLQPTMRTDSLPLIETPAGQKASFVPNSVLRWFLNMEFSCIYFFTTSDPDTMGACGKRLDVLVHRKPQEQRMRIVSSTWTTTSRVAEPLTLQYPGLGWNNELTFAFGFDFIAEQIRDVGGYNLSSKMTADPQFLTTKRIYDLFMLIACFDEVTYPAHWGGMVTQLDVAEGIEADDYHRLDHRMASTLTWRGQGLSAECRKGLILSGGNGVSFQTNWRLVMAEMLGMPRWSKLAGKRAEQA